MDEKDHFASRDAFLAAIRPLLTEEKSNKKTGLFNRAHTIFYETKSHLEPRRANLRQTGNPQIKKEVVEMEQRLKTLSEQYPKEWHAWQVHDEAMRMIIEGVERGIVQEKDMQDFTKIVGE